MIFIFLYFFKTRQAADFGSRLLKIDFPKSRKHYDHEHNQFVLKFGSLYQWRHEQDWTFFSGQLPS